MRLVRDIVEVSAKAKQVGVSARKVRLVLEHPAR